MISDAEAYRLLTKTGTETLATVIIDVSGGVAYVSDCPPWIEVIIRDFDNCETDDLDNLPDYCPDPQ